MGFGDCITDASIRSLAQSIKKTGLLQPLVVRDHPTQPDRWEIRAGEKRWRAAKLAGLAAVPVVVRKLDNETALAVTIAENVQRQDLHPLEEADALRLALDREYDLKAIAARLGKSVQYAARRASLTKLAKVWKMEIRRPNSDAGRLTATHLELIARLPESTQVALAEDGFSAVFGGGFPTVDELREISQPTRPRPSRPYWPVWRRSASCSRRAPQGLPGLPSTQAGPHGLSLSRHHTHESARGGSMASGGQ